MSEESAVAPAPARLARLPELSADRAPEKHERLAALLGRVARELVPDATPAPTPVDAREPRTR